MKLYDKIVNEEEKISVVGLVGMPKKVNALVFDLSRKKVDLYKSGIDQTNEVGDDEYTRQKRD